MPTKWADDFPDWLVFPVYKVPFWKFLSLILAIMLLAAGVYTSLLIGRKIEGSPGKSDIRRQIGNLILAIITVVLLALFDILIRDVIGVRGKILEIVTTTTFIIADIVLIFGVVVLFNTLYSLLSLTKYLKHRNLNEHLIKVVVQLAAVVASTYLAIRAAEYLGLQVVPILAGLGIGGIAIALAARPTVENIIGGLTLFADKPVKVGDFCRFGNEEGFIEEIGLRSTRIRKLDDTLVSVPNAQFSQLELENRTRRRKFLYRTELQFRYETKRDQLRYLLAMLREMLLSHPKAIQDKMRVRFLGFGAHSLDIELFVHIRAGDWPEYLAIKEDLNFRIMDIVRESGTEFAFPSTTAYIAQDGERDEESIKKAEENVAAWKSEGSLPFPNHTRDDIRSLKGRLNYPPEGSIDEKKKTADK
jgi:MscS family membrane protein